MMRTSIVAVRDYRSTQGIAKGWKPVLSFCWADIEPLDTVPNVIRSYWQTHRGHTTGYVPFRLGRAAPVSEDFIRTVLRLTRGGSATLAINRQSTIIGFKLLAKRSG